MQDRPQAIPFIRYTGKFEISPDAAQFLENLPNDMPLAVISIVGKYRTGKSFFVNRVLLNRSGNDGFSVGPTINPCTKGLWLWTEIIQTGNPEFPQMKALVIDTEGFGGMDENVNHDTRIFLFSLLLSSFFIYNSVGSIDENALNNISLIVNLAKEIQVKQQVDNSADPAQFFPQFLWVVRDFALKMVDGNGSPIPSKEYLEKALDQQKGLSDAVEQKNRIRRLIKHFFRERDCVTMVRPVEAETDLQRLDQMKNNDLRHEFVDQIRQVQAKIFKKVRPKILQNNVVTGPMLIQLAKAYLEAINSGGVPNVESAWGYVLRAEGERAVQECSLELEKSLASMHGKLFSSDELSNTRQKLLDQAMKKFRTRAIGQEEDLKVFKEKLLQNFEIQFKELKQSSKLNMEKHFVDITKGPTQSIEDKLTNEQYSNFFELQNDMFKFRDMFDKAVGRNNRSQKFFEQISLHIYQSAAEKLSRKAAQSYLQEKKQMEIRYSSIESELQSRRQDWDQEKQKLQEHIQRLEKEKTQLLVNEQSLNEKLSRLTREIEKMERQFQEYQQNIKDKEIHFNSQYVDQYKNLQNQLERTKTENLQQTSIFEKEMALILQENQFLKRENTNYQERFQLIENESKKQRQENASLNAQNESLQSRISQLDQGRALEIQKLQQEFEKKIHELTQDIDKKKQQARQQNEWLVEKNYLENQVNFLKNQLDENKRLHDALLLALQCKQGINQGESESTQELVETNRNLSATVDKMEMRCRQLEEKQEKLKKFKRMIKNSCALQCLHCQKIISQPIFIQHLNGCSGNSEQVQVQQQQYTKREWSHSQSQQLETSIPIIQTSLENFQVSINQTMVRETADNKPYTEYMIKVQVNDKKWTVSRRYKNFCELHQSLINQFPGLKLPDSSASIVNAQDMNNLFQAKRPTVIEDRRKALQQYLRDLAKIDLIRNSKSYRRFLELDQEPTETSQQSQTRSTSQANNSLINDQQLINKDLKWKQQLQPSGQIIASSTRTSVSNKDNISSQIQTNINRPPLKESITSNLKEGQSSYRIDKKLLPQSPSSFLKSWNEKQTIGEKHRENTTRFTSDHNIYLNNI